MKRRRAQIEDFTVGWICALHIELTAAREVLDEEYERIDDVAHCTLGRIGKHNVAVACLPAGQLGTSSAAAVAVYLQKTFPALQYGLMVGIAGGVPSQEADIRLGDVVISHPKGRYGGVVQYDFGKTGFGGQQSPNGWLNSPHQVLLQAVVAMRSTTSTGRSNMQSYLSSLNERNLFPRPTADTEQLFEASYHHVSGDTCDRCLKKRIVQRIPRTSQDFVIHYGTIASGNQVVKDGLTRDRLSAAYDGVLCFEMEAAGLMNIFPCLVVRGICDYADSHKNKGWQPFAAAAAAACAKEILSYVSTTSRMLGSDPKQPQSFASGASSSGSDRLKTNHGRTPSQERHPMEKNGVDQASLYTESSLTPEQRKAYHNSLYFDQIDARHATIQDAHSETCWWLLRRSEYRDWLSSHKLPEHHGFLWIRGNPGTGKSTLMKFALEATKREVSDATVIKYFFNARGDELEKSVLGMYRSLLFQLLQKMPDLQDVFSLRPPKVSDNETTYLWGVGVLQNLFGHAVKRLGQRSLICFIDALDECDEDQIREMVSFFEDLGDLAASSISKFRTCFSSRHYPRVTLQHVVSLILEDQKDHTEDIAKYVNSKLKGGHSRLFQDIKRKICDRSSGIFLWVVLVVQILKKDFDGGQIQALNKRLEEIPNGLNELFDDILTRDSRNVETLILCLQWILFARRSLEPIELFYAIATGIDPDSSIRLSPEDIDKEVLQNFVLNSSKGLAELTQGRTSTVQFIHESVREYLLKTTCLRRLRADLAFNFSGTSQERLKNCCQNYFTTIVRWDPGAASRNHPFLMYAVCNVLSHADAAAEHGLKQEDFVAAFPYGTWKALRNQFISVETQRYGASITPLYIFANENASNLIKIEARKVPLIDIKGGHYGYPLTATLANRSVKALNALLDANNNDPSSESMAQDEAFYVTPEQREAAIKHCMSGDIGLGKTLLCWAAENDNFSLVKMLLNTHKVDLDFRDELGRTALSWVGRSGRAGLVRQMLKAGQRDIDSKGDFDRTPLSWAARYGHAAVVRLLLETGKVDLNSRSDFGRTPLSWAAILGHTATVKLLLETGQADIESKSESGRTPLSLAAGNGHDAVVKLLLETGKADIESKDLRSWTPLSWAASNGHTATLRYLFISWTSVILLKRKPLDVSRLGLDAEDSEKGTPLHGAVAKKAIEVVKFLVSQNEVDLEAINEAKETPLDIAVKRGYRRIAELLMQARRDREVKASLQVHDRWRRRDFSRLISEQGIVYSNQGRYSGQGRGDSNTSEP